MFDAYVKGRYDKSLFALKRNSRKGIDGDEWDRAASIFFWPIYFVCMLIYHVAIKAHYLVTNGMTDAMNFFEKKGKQDGDINYQIEKHLSED